MEKWILYCDEAGVTHSNNLDNVQPFHVAAGVLVPASAKHNIEIVMKEILSERGVTTELKANSQMKTCTGRRRILTVLNEIENIGAQIFFVVFEKKFFNATKIVSTFLDPVRNPFAHWLPLSKVKLREGYSNILYNELSDELLETFHEWYRKPVCSDDIIREIIAEIDSVAVRETLKNCLGLIDFSQTELHGDRDTLGNFGITGRLNSASAAIPTLNHLVRKVDFYLDDLGTFEVVHDKSPYGQYYSQMLSSDSGSYIAKLLNQKFSDELQSGIVDGLRVRSRNLNYRGFSEIDSKLSPGVQCADFVATAVAQLMIAIKKEAEFGSERFELFNLLIGRLFQGVDPTFAGICASKKIKQRVRDCLSEAENSFTGS